MAEGQQVILWRCPIHGLIEWWDADPDGVACPVAECDDADLDGPMAYLPASLLEEVERELEETRRLALGASGHALALAQKAEAEAARFREALEHIEKHAALDLSERGVAEAERYLGLAREALKGGEGEDG